MYYRDLARERSTAVVRRCRYPRTRFGAYTRVRGQLIITGPGHVLIGSYCTFDSASGRPNVIHTFDHAAVVTIGDYCYLNGIEIASKCSVTCGQRCIIGDCLLMDTDFHSVEINRWDPTAPVRTAPIVLGDNVWLASRTIVLRGVVVGANSVVGAGTVLRGPVPENVVVTGGAYQIVKHLNSSVHPG